MEIITVCVRLKKTSCAGDSLFGKTIKVYPVERFYNYNVIFHA